VRRLRQHPDLPYLSGAGQSSLANVPVALDTSAHARAIKHLRQYRFWDGSGKVLSLWDAQRACISHALGYLYADQGLVLEANVPEAALLKLPTGTGKSGIIAVLSRCIPAIKRVLILTPRTALTDQLLSDIQYRFWQHMGLPVTKKIWTMDSSQAGRSLDPAYLTKLLPSEVGTVNEYLDRENPARVVLVSTLQSLSEIARIPTLVENEKKLGKTIDSNRQELSDQYSHLLDKFRTFDLIIVDEGHYEPAPSWSRSIRALNRPTILLSATPFRNDYKSFRVRGRFVYNMPLQTARDDNIIRHPVFVETVQKPGARQPIDRGNKYRRGSSDKDSLEPTKLTTDDKASIADFVRLLATALPAVLARAKSYTTTPKVMIRADSYEALQLLQSEISGVFGDRPVLIHHRVQPDKITERRFKHVAGAKRHYKDTRFWLHQSKLLEGIDDPHFVAIGLLDGFSNTRQLIQQIGRAIRSTDPKRKQKQIASILALPDVRAEMNSEWDRYLKYEIICEHDISQVIQAEAALPELLLQSMPAYQYIEGEFRAKYLLEGPLSIDDIQLPCRVTAFRPLAGFDLNDAEYELEEAILAADRFVPRTITNLPSGVFARSYYSWNNAEILTHQYLTEWSLGVCVATHIGNYLFVLDTQGICFDPKDLKVARVEREILLKAFPASANSNDTVITRMASTSLDMSDRAIRTQAIRTRSFDTTFTDLSDPFLAPSSVYGYIKGRGRYVGLSRARIADASDGLMPLSDYLKWLQQVKDSLDNAGSPHRVFDRYAQMETVTPSEAKAHSILLDLTAEAFQEFQVQGDADSDVFLGHQLPYDDLCSDVDANGCFHITATDGTKVACDLKYSVDRRRYRIESADLNKRHPPGRVGGGRRARTLTEQINKEQNFRVLIEKAGIVYSQGRFFKIGDLVSSTGEVAGLQNALSIPALKNIVSEKGEKFFNDPTWKTESILGLVYACCQGSASVTAGTEELGRAITELDTVVLDDGGTEIGDLIGLDTARRRVIIIHAKASKETHNEAITELQAVGRQAIASLAFCSTQARVDGLEQGRWQRSYTANAVPLPLSRVFKQPAGQSYDQLETAIKRALVNPTWNKEIWIMVGRILDVGALESAAKANSLTNRRRQILMYLAGLQTACARANARLQLLAH
jgi:superfamily II DNA or RNA helicase